LATDLDSISTLPKTSSVKFDLRAAVKLPSYAPFTLLLLDVHAPVTLILKANETSAVRRADTHRSGEGIGQRLAQELDAQAGAIDGLVVVGVHRVVVAKLEGAVLDELGVYAAVATVVDVLVKEAIAVVDTEVLCRVASRRANFDRGCGDGGNAACGQHGLVYQAHCEKIWRDCATQEGPWELRRTGGILTACYILPQAIGDEVHKVLAAAVGVIIVLLQAGLATLSSITETNLSGGKTPNRLF
jgi:hypothetical protein